MKYYQQLDISDCGAACLSMIASCYKKYSSITEIRRLSGTDLDGTNIYGLLKAAEQLNFKAEAVKGEIEGITKDIPTPFIVHIKRKSSNSSLIIDHFCVVKKIFSRKIEIWDPDPLVKKNLIKMDEFSKIWTGYAIFLKPDYTFEPDKEVKSLLLKFLPIFLPHKKILILVSLSSILLVVFGIIVSFYYKYIFDEIIFSKAKMSLTSLSLGVMFIGVVQSVVSAVRGRLLAFFSFKSDIHLKFSYIKHLLNLPLAFFESRKTGEIMSRLNDLKLVRNTLSNVIISIILDIFMILIVGPILWNISSILFGIEFLSILLIALIVIFFSRIFRRIYSKSMMLNAEVNSHIVESISGIATIKAMNSEDNFFSIYSMKQLSAQKINWKSQNYSVTQNLITGIISIITTILIFWIGSLDIINGKISLGTLITFNALSVYFSGPLSRLVNMQSNVQQAIVAAERVGEILEEDTEYSAKNKYINTNTIVGDIKFSNVTFRYGSRHPIFNNLSFTINKGTWNGIVGPSGCGKTTIIKLLLKFYVPEEGAIFIDNYDSRDIDARSLRQNIGYVPQEVFLFSGTIAENIALRNPSASLEKIISAAKKAGADDFISKLPKRYNTSLGEHGGGLSGGERQRIALARALIDNPSLVILDEATSNLDSISEDIVHDVVRKLRAERVTVVIIAHRLTSVIDCDNILVMNKGSIVQIGKHSELLKEDGLYKDMWREE